MKRTKSNQEKIKLETEDGRKQIRRTHVHTLFKTEVVFIQRGVKLLMLVCVRACPHFPFLAAVV